MAVCAVLAERWDSLTTQLDPSSALVLATGAGALVAVVVDVIWLRARHVVTIVHEAAMVVALLTGRRLTGIELRTNTSGLTLSVGGPAAGMVITAAAGYLSPRSSGWSASCCWPSTRSRSCCGRHRPLLVAMLIMVRNLYGALALVVTGAVVVGVSLYTEPDVQAAFAYAMTWFLLLGAVRPVNELRSAPPPGANTDADTLARITPVPPGEVWRRTRSRPSAARRSSLGGAGRHRTGRPAEASAAQAERVGRSPSLPSGFGGRAQASGGLQEYCGHPASV